jgi:sulfate transport system substrate-binding protein
MTTPRSFLRLFLTIVMLATLVSCRRHDAADGSVTLLHVSYDATRELFTDINAAFAKSWLERTGQTVRIKQSHGGSSKQARAVMEGLDADVVSLGLGYDVDAIADQTALLPRDWEARAPHGGSPFTSTIVFLVRRGNPKSIRGWDDLVRPDVSVITPNPKTSGSARWTYLAAWGFAMQRELGDLAKLRDPGRASEVAAAEEKAQAFVTALYNNVAVLDSGGRGSTTTFVSRGTGDVLVNWENEVRLAVSRLGADAYEVVTPTVSILAEPAVSVVDQNVARHGTAAVANAYVEFLYSEAAQEIAARHHFRPRAASVAAPRLVTIEALAGDWKRAQRVHFDDGGRFDRIFEPIVARRP